MNRPHIKRPISMPEAPNIEPAPGAHPLKAPAIPCLQDCIARYASTLPGLADLGRQLQGLVPSPEAGSLDALIDLYEQCYPLLEQAMWSGEADFHALLASYQVLFREQEALIRQRGNDTRHRFILAIPIADRPPHLRACLESIYQLCALFDYGGKASGLWDKIRVIVSEDSRDEANIRRHVDLVAEYRQKGLQVVHFGLDEQYELLHALPQPQRERLGHLLTTQPRDRFYLKGQAANRNLSYLKFLQLTEDKANTLYYLVDSDQSFCVNLREPADRNRRRGGLRAQLLPRHRPHLPHHRHPHAHRQDGRRPARLAVGHGREFSRRRQRLFHPPGRLALRRAVHVPRPAGAQTRRRRLSRHGPPLRL